MFKPYFTISKAANAQYIEKKSRFIGYISPIKSKDEANSFIKSIKEKHKDARHNVSAYSLYKGGILHCSDDGEPQGTAGVPVLEVLKKEEVFDVCVVVTRYFGGVLLGGGGLVRAYSHTCKLALDAAEIVVQTPCEELVVILEYPMLDKINYILPKFNPRNAEYDYGEKVKIKMIVKAEDANDLKKELQSYSFDKIKVNSEGQKMMPYPIK